MLSKIISSIILATLGTLFSYLLAYVVGWRGEFSWLTFAAVYTSYASTYLCVVQSRFNYVWGAISTALYVVLFLQLGLYASAALNAYLTPVLLYGWFYWRKDSNTRPVSWLGFNGWWAVYALITFAVWLPLMVLCTYLGGTQPILDSLVVALLILAQLLLDRKKIECWFVFAIANVISINLYGAADIIVGIQYAFFLGNTIYGFYLWYHSMKVIPTPIEKEETITLDFDQDFDIEDGDIVLKNQYKFDYRANPYD